MSFVKATKEQAKARIALVGLSGSGKTWTGLLWARVLAGDTGRIAVIDTEAGSASKYADQYQFDTNVLENYSPRDYIAALHEAEKAGYDVLLIDSLSHAWMGKGGVLQIVDDATARSRSKNTFSEGWREATPEHNSLVDAMVRCKCHLIVTMRVKQDYVIEEVNGKKIPRKVGLAPVQRDGLEYEFDLVADMDLEHTLVVGKTRCSALDGKVHRKPDETLAITFKDWLNPVITEKDANISKAFVDMFKGAKSEADYAAALDMLKAPGCPVNNADDVKRVKRIIWDAMKDHPYAPKKSETQAA